MARAWSVAMMLMLALALLAACSAPSAATPTAEDELRYLALGDSYTIGESVSAAERWPVQLAARLRERGVQIAEPVVIARTGWTSDELQAAIEREYDGGTYDLVSLLIGVNDQYRGYPSEQYRGHLRELLQFAIRAAGGEASRVILLSIPDWGDTPFASGQDRERIAAEIDEFNAVGRQEAKAAGVQFFDITPISRMADEHAELIAGDRLHPSGQMYAAWVEEVLHYVTDLFAN
jgi:lysophospholipase L1-like esterase